MDRWLVIFDRALVDDPHRTRADARASAAWWRRHPSVVDRRRFGRGVGPPRVVDLEHAIPLARAGWPQEEIAEELGIPLRIVFRYLA